MQFTDEQLLEAIKLRSEHSNTEAAARAGNIPASTFRRRLKAAAERGLMSTDPVMPGYVIKSVASKDDEGHWVKQVKEPGEEFETPAGHTIKGVSALVDGDGRIIQQWLKTRNEYAPADIAEILKTAFADYEGRAKPLPAPLLPEETLLTLTPCNDWHVGMYAWRAETGANWDLKLAEDIIGKGMDELVARSPCSAEAIVLGGGDLLHADNKDNQTAKSHNVLDVDGRYQKVLMAASRLMVRAVDAHLLRHKHVIVRILPGNHDEHSSVAVAYFLLAWYRDEPRVTVDVDPSLFFWFRRGLVFLGATHGHTVKINAMPGIMAHRRAEDWGASRFRYIHGFHLHHTAKYASEGNGVISEVHQAPIPQDAWHVGAGFLSGRSLQSITYHTSYGEVSRSRIAIIDGARKEAA